MAELSAIHKGFSMIKYCSKLFLIPVSFIFLSQVVAAQTEDAQSLARVSFIFDIVLILIGIYITYQFNKITVSGFRFVAIGFVILGLIHFIETVLFEFDIVSTEVNELLHRILVLIAFLWITYGLFKIQNLFSPFKKKQIKV